MEPANTSIQPAPMRTIPTWLEEGYPEKPKVATIQSDRFEHPLFPIKQISTLNSVTTAISHSAAKAIALMRQFTEYWNLYAIRMTIPDLEKAVKDLPDALDLLINSMDKYEEDIRRRKNENIKKDAAEIVSKLNRIAHTIFFSFTNTTHSIEKYEAAHKFSFAIYTLKRSALFKSIWAELTLKTKQVCDAALPHAEAPGELIDIDVPMFNFDEVYQSQIILVTGSRLRYLGELKSKENGSVTFKTAGNDDLIIWTGVKTLPDSADALLIKQNKRLLSEIEKARQCYSSCMENCLPRVYGTEESQQNPVNIHNKAIQHQRFRLVQYYFQLMFSSLGIPVRLPKYVGSSSEYWIVSSDKSTPFTAYLNKNPAIQRSYARRVAEIYQKELLFGLKCLKSCQFEIHDDKVFACDLEDSFLALPAVSDRMRRITDVAMEIKATYTNFPEFVSEFLKYTDLFLSDCQVLNDCKMTKTPTEFHKVLMLAHLCSRYDISLSEILNSKVTPQTAAMIVQDEVEKLINLMPKKGEPVEALHTKTHFEGNSSSSFLVIDSHATLLDTQFAQCAHLERLIVKDLITTSLNSSSELAEDFCEINLELKLQQYLPAEKDSLYSVNDSVGNVADYFSLLFWNDFIDHLARQINTLLEDPFYTRTDYLACPTTSVNGYKELLHRYLIEFNKVRQANEFFDKLVKIQTFS